MAELLNLVAKITLDKSEYDKGLGDAEKSASGFGGKLGGALGSGVKTVAKVGAAAVAAATAATTAFAASSVKVGMDFDTSMAQVAATSGKSMDELLQTIGSVDTAYGQFSGNLREYAQFMGANTAFSAKQAADALNYMALAGYDAQTSMNMLPNVLNLAAAGSMDLARASDMITDTQTAFGISLERTTQLVDEMAKAASTGNTSVEQLGDAFLVVGGLAKELNGGFVFLDDGTQVAVDGFQEMEIALTAMANAGIKGSEAGTHMRNMIMKLSSPTKEGAKVMQELGLNVFNASGDMRPLSNIIHDLNISMQDLTQEQKIKAVSALFNSRDLASAEALLGAIEQDWDKIGVSILEAEGSAQKMADTQLDNLNGDVTIFKSALEGAQIAISDKLTPGLRGFVKFGTKGLSDLTKAFQSGGLSSAMTVFGDLLAEGLVQITEALPRVVEAGMSIVSALGQGIMDNLPVFVDTGVQIVLMLADYILQALPGLADAAVQIINQLGTSLGEALPELVPKVTEVFMTIVETLTSPGTLNTLVDTAISIVTGLAEGIGKALPIMAEKAPEIIMNLAAAIATNLPKIVLAGIDIIVQLVSGLVQAYPQIVEASKEIVPKIVSKIAEGLPDMLHKGWELVLHAAQGISEKLPDILQKGREMVENAVNGIGEKISDLITKGQEFIAKIVEGIQQKIEDLKTKGREAVDKVGEGIKGVIDNAKQWGIDLMNNFISGIESKLNALGDTIGKVAGKVKGVIGFSEPEEGPLSDFHTYAPDMMKLFAQGIRDNTYLITEQLAKSFDFGDNLIGTVSESTEGLRAETGRGMTSININVYGAEGQDVEELAQIVSDKINRQIVNGRRVWEGAPT